MDDIAAAVATLTDLTAAVAGPFEDLRTSLLVDARPRGLFSELELQPCRFWEARASVQLMATRTDGRDVAWVVEVSIYATGHDNWAAVIKAEIDLDDEHGDDWCVLNEQNQVTEVGSIRTAIAHAARRVADYPLRDLFTPGWEPPDWGPER